MADTDDKRVVQDFDVTAPAANDGAAGRGDPMISSEHLTEEELAEGEQLAALAMGEVGAQSPEAKALFVERITQFLSGVCPNPYVLAYLSQCADDDAFIVCREIANVHSRIAVNALYSYAKAYYPELTDPDAIDQKVLEIETKSPLSWKAADARKFQLEGESDGDKPTAILSVCNDTTDRWEPLYNFGVYMKEVGPDVDGTEVSGYLPCVAGQILVKPPTVH